ncbi:MAG: anhydro-N-acetylmuramic acid kinase [Hyphomicrobiaceae bacterium]
MSKVGTTVKRAIGLMSGTSMDGIDIALVETDGETYLRRGPAETHAYPAELRDRLRACLATARSLKGRQERPGALADVERELTERHAEAVLRFMGDRALQPFAVDVIGFHGQTVLHRPEAGLTVQLGDGPALARRTGIDVVYDLRAADVAAGGQGAPLVPIYHRALVARLPERPLAIVNIGGVANITYVGRNGDLIAFDTGPGNALIDDWVARQTGSARDENGALAAQGRIDEAALRYYLSHPYFAKLPPKSLDRDAFPVEAVSHLSAKDGAATLTAFTAEAIAKAREHLPEQPELWIISGGGRRNRTLMGMIAGRVENAVVPAEAVALDGDTVEAEAWAYLAVRALAGLPITFPGTTGVRQPLSGGVLARRDGA